MIEEKEKTMAVTIPDGESWVLLQKQCKAFIASGYLPEHITKGVPIETAMAKAITIVMKGRELGIPPLQAFSSITVIKGKPCLSSELMLALIYSRVRGAKITFRTPPEKQHLECTVEMQRPGGEPQFFRFTIEDAKKAELQFKSATTGLPTAWAKYPSAMLRARVISAGARAVFPDAVMGAYTPEELGGEVIDAEVVENVSAAPEPTIQKGAASPAKAEPAKTTSHGDYERAKPGWENDLATEKQIARLHAIGKSLGYSHDDLKTMVGDAFGRDHLEELTKSEIQVMFKELEGEGKPAVGSAKDIRSAAMEMEVSP